MFFLQNTDLLEDPDYIGSDKEMEDDVDDTDTQDIEASDDDDHDGDDHDDAVAGSNQ